MITNSQRTIYGLEVQTAMMAGVPHVPRINTTLNEKHNLSPNAVISAGSVYGIKAFAIGIGGTLANNITGYTYSQHSPLDAALFEQVPYVMCPVVTDISLTEQAKYRFKKRITHNGTDYYQYFLRVILPSDITRGTFTVVPTGAVGGNLVALTTNTVAYLNPTPLSNNRTFGVNKEYINTSIKIKFAITPNELANINTAIDILYGVNSGKSLSEIGICGGVETNIAGATELVHTQIYYHIGVNISLQISYDPVIGYLRAIEVGGSEPNYI